jgi:hypothetical protein
MIIKLLPLFLFIFFVSSCTVYNKKIEVSLLNKNCIIPLGIEGTKKFKQCEQSCTVQIEVLEGSSSKHRILRMKNISNKSINFFDIKTPYFHKIMQGTANPNYVSAVALQSQNKVNQYQEIIKNKYAINCAKIDNQFYIRLCLFSNLELKPNDFLDVEIEFEHEGQHQVLINFEEDRTENGLYTGRQIRAISSKVFRIEKSKNVNP